MTKSVLAVLLIAGVVLAAQIGPALGAGGSTIGTTPSWLSSGVWPHLPPANPAVPWLSHGLSPKPVGDFPVGRRFEIPQEPRFVPTRQPAPWSATASTGAATSSR